MTLSIMDWLAEGNDRFAEDFAHGHLSMVPAKQVAIVTCMDPRLHPEKFLGLSIGDAHVIRNAGGRVSGDVIRSLIVSARLLRTREFVVIHHNDCSMLTFSNADLHQHLASETGLDATHIDFLPFSDITDSVREDVDALRSSPYLPTDSVVSGLMYDVFSGRIERVM